MNARKFENKRKKKRRTWKKWRHTQWNGYEFRYYYATYGHSVVVVVFIVKIVISMQICCSIAHTEHIAQESDYHTFIQRYYNNANTHSLCVTNAHLPLTYTAHSLTIYDDSVTRVPALALFNLICVSCRSLAVIPHIIIFYLWLYFWSCHCLSALILKWTRRTARKWIRETQSSSSIDKVEKLSQKINCTVKSDLDKCYKLYAHITFAWWWWW